MQKPLSSKKPLYIGVKISDDAEIKAANKKYLKRDYTTDVLSFEVNEDSEDGTYYLGDVLVNREQAKRQAAKYKNTYEHEVAELVAHGVLHLLGVHHKDDDEKSVHGVKS
ncbi:MAG TPA: rRNA maturation RNase YbeY [Candidatus Saccharimonadales bacterium]|nr:rRNA maturation RNase YbeY [Candidatus Saccharimonadales bacterium]